MPDIKCILVEQGGKGGGAAAVVPTKLIITTQPTKRVYRVGDSFDISGLEATVSYGAPGSALSMGTANIPSDIGYSSLVITPSTNLQETDTKVTISYIENDVTVSADIPITVKNSNLEITGPTTTSYAWGQAFSTAGLVIKDADGTAISNYTLKINSVVLTNGTALSNAAFIIGTNNVDVSATGADGAPLTGDFNITITKASVTIPTQNGSLIYTGSAQTPTWNDKNDALMTLTITAQTNAGGPYDAKFNLKDTTHYQWNDGTITEKNQTWTIAKATLTDAQVTVSGNTAIDASNLTRTITVTIPTGETGTIDISPSSGVSGLTITKGTQTANARTFTFKGNGSTALTQAFTVTVNGCVNYNNYSKSSKFTITATYWTWGSETATSGDVGNTAWWTGLQKWVQSASDTELAACVGKTKYVTLSAAVRSVTGHLVRCIGYNRDGAHTLTFQTDTCFLESNTENNYFCTSSEYSTFGSQALWTNGTTDSQARRQCKAYYNAFPGKSAIKPVQKRYLSTQSNNVHNTACDKTYEETVFLPSENEMGWKSTGYASGSVGYGSANNEVCTANTGVEQYQYYTDNAKRVKKAQGTHSQNGNNWYYWERSRYCSTTGPSCVCYVGTDGSANYGSSDNDYGLAPAFVIG